LRRYTLAACAALLRVAGSRKEAGRVAEAKRASDDGYCRVATRRRRAGRLRPKLAVTGWVFGEKLLAH